MIFVIYYLLLSVLVACVLAYDATDISEENAKQLQRFDSYAIIFVMFIVCLLWPIALAWKAYKNFTDK